MESDSRPRSCEVRSFCFLRPTGDLFVSTRAVNDRNNAYQRFFNSIYDPIIAHAKRAITFERAAERFPEDIRIRFQFGIDGFVYLLQHATVE